MVLQHPIDAGRGLDIQQEQERVRVCLEQVSALLRNIPADGSSDVRERAEQALAALYRLEWALRGSARSEIALLEPRHG